MRWKHGTEGHGVESGCCWCCHIRTGAIVMGIIHLLWYILGLVIAGFIIVVMKQLVHLDTDSVSLNDAVKNQSSHDNEALSVYLNTLKFNRMENSYNWDDDDQYFILAVFVGCIICSVLLVYGAAKGEGSYLMPFFILKVFSFSLGCLYMVSFCGSWANAEFEIDKKTNRMDVNYPVLFMSGLFIVGVWLEAYFAYVAWACYRYLRLSEIRSTVNNDGGYRCEENAEMMLPPKYEDVILIPVDQDPTPVPPPAYEVPVAAAQEDDDDASSEEDIYSELSETRALITN